MDKKSKKRVDVLRTKIQKLRVLLAGAKAQPDDPREIETVKQEIARCEAEIATLNQP